MIVLQQVDRNGEIVLKGLPVANIQEVNPHPEHPENSWVKYWIEGMSRSVLVVGKVQHIADAINQVKKLHNG